MRISGGKARSTPLKSPKGDTTRPATDRMRESIFSSLGASIEGCRVADLFAGSGSYGLEALSRGACSVDFFEIDRKALACLRENTKNVLQCCELNSSSASITNRDVFKLSPASAPYDLIFCDPPYEIIEASLDKIFNEAIALISSEHTRVILELPGNLVPNISNWELTKRLGKVGKNKPTIAIFKRVI